MKKKTSVLEIPAGINIEELPISSNVVKLSLKNDDGKYKIGYVGSLTRPAGLEVLVDAMNIVKKKFPNAILQFTGKGDPIYIEELMKKCTEYNLNSIFEGEVSHKTALEIMSGLDMLVVPRIKTLSAELTIPIKVIEAFSLGVPVIITKHRVFLQKYVDGKDVILVSRNSKALAKQIIYLLENPLYAKYISKQGMLNSQEYDYKFLAGKLTNALRALS